MSHIINTIRGSFGLRSYGKPSNLPLILIHGWPQSSYCWHHMTPYLQDYYVIAVDLRGMGDSNRTLDLEFYHKDQMALDVFAIADELGFSSFALGGHDWGGAIVQEMVHIDASRITALIIINMVIINNHIGEQKATQILIPHHYRSSWYQHMLSIKDFPEALLEGKEDIWVPFFSRGISNPIPEDAIEEYIRCYKIPGTITTAANIYRTLKHDRKRWKSLEGIQIHIPTLIIHGQLDPVIIKEYLIGVDDVFTNLVIDRLNGGHFICDEQPQDVAQSIVRFLKKI